MCTPGSNTSVQSASCCVSTLHVSFSFFRCISLWNICFGFNGSERGSGQQRAAVALPFLYRYRDRIGRTVDDGQGICIGWDRNLLFMTTNAAALVYGRWALPLQSSVHVKYAAMALHCDNESSFHRRRRSISSGISRPSITIACRCIASIRVR